MNKRQRKKLRKKLAEDLERFNEIFPFIVPNVWVSKEELKVLYGMPNELIEKEDKNGTN